MKSSNHFATVLRAAQQPRRMPLLRMVSWLLVLVGVGAFLLGIRGWQAQRIWQAYLVNFVFWSGLAFGSVFFVAVVNMTRARFGRPFKRSAEALGGFIPVSFLLFWVLFLGRRQIFPWVTRPFPGKEFWLNGTFFFLREGLGLFLLTAAGVALIYQSLSSDLKVLTSFSATDGLAEVSPGTSGQAAARSWNIQQSLSPLFALLYVVILSLLALDLIMSLDPQWYSTLFGAYFFTGSFYTALAALSLLTALVYGTRELKGIIQPRHFHGQGKLLFGMCLLTGDFFFSQFLLIWYGNLPDEARYVIERLHQGPWERLAWVVFVLIFALPILVLLSRKIKMKPAAMLLVGGVILTGMWLERFLLVVPSLWKQRTIPLGMPELLITAGFLGVMSLCVLLYMRKFPLLPLSDPLLRESLEGG